MAINLPPRLRDESFATSLVRRYFATDTAGKKVLGRPRTDNQWWHDLHGQIVCDPGLVEELESVRSRAGAGHMSLLRVFDVMCWMFSGEGEQAPAAG